MPTVAANTVEAAARKEPVPTWMLVLSSLLVLGSVVFYGSIYWAGESFSTLFAGFGGELPTYTRVVLAVDEFAVLLVLVGLVPMALLFKHRRRGVANADRYFYWVVASFILSIVATGLWLAGAYLPVFKMGMSLS